MRSMTSFLESIYLIWYAFAIHAFVITLSAVKMRAYSNYQTTIALARFELASTGSEPAILDH